MHNPGLAGMFPFLKRLYAWCMNQLYHRTVPVLAVLFCLGLAIMLWHVSHLQSSLMETMAVADAELYTQALAEFRTLYTREVVERVRPLGIEVTHDYKEKEGAIPLPATLSMVLGRSIGDHQSGAETRLYSAYPFPWREGLGGAQDEFGRKAWNTLTQNPDKPVYGFEEVKGRFSLRYATADLMRDSCVDCHNTHPDSPKTDWKTGDVRGVLEIIHPMDTIAAEARIGMGETFGVMSMLAMLWLGGLGLVISKLRRDSTELEQRVNLRTSELRDTNRELEKQIAERKRAEAELYASNARLAGVLDTAEEAVISVDETQCITLFNKGAAKVFGYTPEEVEGRPLDMLLPARAVTAHRQHIRSFGDAPDVARAMSDRTEVYGRRKDGSEFPAEVSISKLTLNERITFTAILRDVAQRKRAEDALLHAYDDLEDRVAERTAGVASANALLEEEIAERKQVQEELRASQEFLNTLMGSVGDAIFTVSMPDRRIEYANQAVREILGYEPEEVMGQHTRAFYPDEQTFNEFGKKLQGTLARGEHQLRTEQVMRRKTGEILWTEVITTFLFTDGRPSKVISVVRDVTARKEAEEALRQAHDELEARVVERTARLGETNTRLESEVTERIQVMAELEESAHKFRTLSESLPIGVFEVDSEGHCIYRNQAWQDIFEHSSLDGATARWVNWFHPDEHRALEKDWQESKAKYRRIMKDCRVVVAQKEERWIRLQLSPMISDTGSRYLGTIEDITQRKQAERALLQLSRHNQMLLTSAEEGIYGLDLEGKTTFMNPAAARMLGYEPEELIGKPQHALSHHSKPDGSPYPRKGCPIYAAFTDGHVHHVETEVFWRRNGSSFPVEYTSTPIRDEHDHLVGAVVTFHDITQRKQAEEQLTEAYERLRQLTGQLAAAEEEERKRIARELHDEFGQILTGLKFDLAWMGRRLLEKPVGPRKVLQDKVRSMSALVDTTIQAVQRISASLRPSILDDLGLAAAVEWLGQSFQSRMGYECEVAISPRITKISIDSDRGLALFRVAQELLTNVMRHAAASKVWLKLGEEDGILILEVGDNGRGIRESEMGSPQSLGVRGMRERASLLGGEVSIRGQRGKGTTVMVRMPARYNEKSA